MRHLNLLNARLFNAVILVPKGVAPIKYTGAWIAIMAISVSVPLGNVLVVGVKAWLRAGNNNSLSGATCRICIASGREPPVHFTPATIEVFLMSDNSGFWRLL